MRETLAGEQWVQTGRVTEGWVGGWMVGRAGLTAGQKLTAKAAVTAFVYRNGGRAKTPSGAEWDEVASATVGNKTSRKRKPKANEGRRGGGCYKRAGSGSRPQCSLSQQGEQCPLASMRKAEMRSASLSPMAAPTSPATGSAAAASDWLCCWGSRDGGAITMPPRPWAGAKTVGSSDRCHCDARETRAGVVSLGHGIRPVLLSRPHRPTTRRHVRRCALETWRRVALADRTCMWLLLLSSRGGWAARHVGR